MNVGYSTHGCWASLEKIKHLEVEDRGNPWFEDDGLDLESLEGIWVTLDPQKALWYREALKNAETHLFQVDLTGAVEVLRDGEGGFLYIRRKEANQNGKEVRRCGTNQPRKS
jgi:hypothetical protein